MCLKCLLLVVISHFQVLLLGSSIFWCKSKCRGHIVGKIGDKIKVGQDLGYIYVMGLKTPLKSTVGGEVTEITVEDGGVVDYGKVILKVKATAR